MSTYFAPASPSRPSLLVSLVFAAVYRMTDAQAERFASSVENLRPRLAAEVRAYVQARSAAARRRAA